MRKLLNKPWFVIAVAAIAIALVARSVLSSSGSSPWSAGSAAVVESPDDDALAGGTEPAEGTQLSIGDALRSLGLAENATDPFRARAPIVVPDGAVAPPPPPPDEVETVQLSAVWTQGASRFALINNRPSEAGERIGRITVESIELAGIWVSHSKGRDFVPFGTAFTLVTPAAAAAKPIALHEE